MLRSAGPVELLREAGDDVVDFGDRPVARWRAHPQQRRPHDLTRNIEVSLGSTLAPSSQPTERRL
ncbi:hypothetical protein Vau01_123350 [Virgisporangium aurantiacum]|uniref:Uncharacterized protein n=1 Tax=Virgisporangium aurantiacum TaxID=175570 RepID=A0A8J3ZIE5_9ACTN|nr:hypothetical protein Vau01_123350 [Virgisporangium aurantiacum]